MNFNEYIKPEYFDKIILTLIPLIVKGLLGDMVKLKKILSIILNYIIPAITILWILIDDKIFLNKLVIVLITFNFAFLLFNFLNKKLIEHYEIISKYTNAETDKIKEVNNINAVQVEKIKCINENQKYLIEEVSKVNDRINRLFENLNSK